jgi:hypothetical protein
MKKTRRAPEAEEPIGIIISHGKVAEQEPHFRAYIWGPAPEPTPEATIKAA